MDSTAETAKRDRRVEMRAIRAAIPDREARVPEMWAEVIDECVQRSARTVMAFVGVGTEPDTSVLIAGLHAAGFVVVLPRVEGQRIAAATHDPLAPMAAGRYGIPAPAGEPVDPETIDVVIVPGLAFTRDGRRLGQGGGYYDRFLPQLDRRCTTIGVCFREQLVDDLDTLPHDRTVDLVVTDGVRE
ncbi:MAG: putative 5-formyltetrahydrofolate cyclo-ligase [Acidimicrobiales bacterium]|nr:putative 5-formyltetrahydrofolate cyclo-ligase [Acidimicrobiales bacterium]